MNEVIKIIEKRIELAGHEKSRAQTSEIHAFWDGQLRCAQALLNELSGTLKMQAETGSRMSLGELTQMHSLMEAEYSRKARERRWKMGIIK